jgi:NAD(P)-dependent dehydrogenase (short-subunit alcohol dehydrogenase family)
MPKVFLITGCSSGFGKEYVEEVLKRGDIAVATARKPESLKFKGANEKNLLALRLDVNDQSSIDKAFEDALKKFGRIDVVSLVHSSVLPSSKLAAGLQ